MPRYAVTDQAKADVREIVAYIADRDPAAAAKVRARLRDAMRALAASPGIGHFRADLTAEPVRFWAVYSYLIVYLPDAKPLVVVAVLHGARDFSGEVERRLDDRSG